LPSLDLDAARREVAAQTGHQPTERELASYLMYPHVYLEFAKQQAAHGNVDNLETPVFFYGMQVGQEIAVELERGKTLFVRYAALGEPDELGMRTVYFELNGQPRTVSVADRHLAGVKAPPRKADPANAYQVGAPMPGQIVKALASEGRPVQKGDALLTLEAMKMQTVIHAPLDGVVESVLAPIGSRVAAGDLLVVLQPAS
jgi:pyruvate carboxylase